MKKIKFSVLILVLGFVSFLSCETSSDVVMASDVENAVAVENDNMSTARPGQGNYRFNGHVEFWNNTRANEFGLFFVDSDSIYHYMLIEGNTIISAFTDGEYDLELFEDGLVMKSILTPESIWFIGINTDESNALFNELNQENIFEGSNLAGFALRHSWAPAASFDNVNMRKAILQFEKLSALLDIGAARSCNSGEGV